MSAPVTKKPRRPWYRPHASTWLVMALALGAMTFWNVAGYYEDLGPRYWASGWPRTYLRREVVWYDSSGRPTTGRISFGPIEVHWRDSVTWRLWEGKEFRLTSLMTDVGAAALLILGVATSFETWRRRRSRLFQIHLIEVFTAVMIVSVVLGVGRSAIISAREREQTLSELQQSRGVTFHVRRGTPEFIWQVLPGSWWKVGDFSTEVTCNGEVLTPETVRTIRSYSNPTKLDLYDVEIMQGAFGELAAFSNLKEMRLCAMGLDDESFRRLPSSPVWRRLNWSCLAFLTTDFATSGRCQASRS